MRSIESPPRVAGTAIDEGGGEERVSFRKSRSDFGADEVVVVEGGGDGVSVALGAGVGAGGGVERVALRKSRSESMMGLQVMS